MSQAEVLASHWVLLFFLGLLNKYMLVWCIDYPSIRLSSSQGDYNRRSWSEWSLWSACSRSCGGGVKMRNRTCKISNVQNKIRGNNICDGESVEYELCSVHNCSPFNMEFLEYQCSLKNGLSIAGKKIDEWVPYRYGTNPCELQCWSKDRSRIHSFGKTIDGTKCAVAERSQQPALCINGRCTPVDCAGQIGHDNKLDRCGVCRGNNSTCVHLQEIIGGRPRHKASVGISRGSHFDYEKIATIPAGATEVLITESSENNFLALVDYKGEYQVNGNWRIQAPGKVSVHGSDFLYNRTWGEESLSTLGPIRFDVQIHVLGSGAIPTVEYEYWISSKNPYRTVQSLETLNRVKQENDENTKFVAPKYFPPENNHKHESPSSKKPSTSKGQSYNSYYHRNEILRSVPSWSIKRHRTHNRHAPNENRHILTNYTDTKIVPLDTRHSPPESVTKINRSYAENRTLTGFANKEQLNVSVNNKHSNTFTDRRIDRESNYYNLSSDLLGHDPTTSPIANKMPVSFSRDNLPSHSSDNKLESKSRKNKTLSSSIGKHVNFGYTSNKLPNCSAADKLKIDNELDKTVYSYNTELENSDNLKSFPTNDGYKNALANSNKQQRHPIVVTLNNNKRSDFSNRKILLENTEQNVDQFGRPTNTLAQTVNSNVHSRSAVTQYPPHLERNLLHENGRRRSELHSSRRPNNKKRRKSENDSCSPCPKPKNQKRIFCTSDFVLRAVVLSIKKQDDTFRYELEVRQSYKNRVPILPREYVWTIDSCRCPKLRTGNEYIIMGYSGTSGNTRESRLLLNRNSFAKKYSHKRAHNVLRMARGQATMCTHLD